MASDISVFTHTLTFLYISVHAYILKRANKLSFNKYFENFLEQEFMDLSVNI